MCVVISSRPIFHQNKRARFSRSFAVLINFYFVAELPVAELHRVTGTGTKPRFAAPAEVTRQLSALCILLTVLL